MSEPNAVPESKSEYVLHICEHGKSEGSYCQQCEEVVPHDPHPAKLPDAAPEQDATQNLRYAKQIAEYMAKNFYPDVPQWQPLEGDLFGLLSQIDNMATGLMRKPKLAAAQPDGWIAVTAERDRYKKALEYILILSNLYLGEDFKDGEKGSNYAHVRDIAGQMVDAAESALSPTPPVQAVQEKP